jgi:pyruvate formate lyase activating enzyme
MKKPLIVDIKRGGLMDGPGIRSVVFFKGCPLKCVFCQNPEAQYPEAELAFFKRECIKCNTCVEACPQKAIDPGLEGRINRDKCIRCGICADACPGKGLRVIGIYYAVEELVDILMEDYNFYRNSNGGVTLSGGECTLYPDYLESLLKPLKAKSVHVALETSGYFDYEIVKEKILPYIDIIYYDIKIFDKDDHIRFTGKSNQKILDNLKYLINDSAVEVHPRIPIIPGITDTRENLSNIVGFLRGIGCKEVSLIPYNPMWIDMAESLGRPKSTLPGKFMKPEREREVYDLIYKVIKQAKS